ncbi:MAG TPA: hypothetical protein VMT64_11875 [Candidatus Binataceae bacterium]|nr:hypothetical protein [Candidatus Binataceae bacterium]
MTPAEKGERYARIFRKAGALLANGSIARAVEAFKEGVKLAEEQGDAKMAARFQAEIDRAQAGSGRAKN